METIKEVRFSEKMKCDTNKKSVAAKFFKGLFNCLLIVLVFLPNFYLYKYVEPVRRGLFCDDESIQYPRKPSIVSSKALFLACFLAVPLVLIVAEALKYTVGNVRKSSGRYPVKARDGIGSCLSGFFGVVFITAGFYLFGAIGTFTMTNVVKFSVGRPRPFFWDFCKPNIAEHCLSHPQALVTNYNCTSSAHRILLKDARLSFPSGHSSISFHAAVFLIYFVHRNLNSIVLLKPWIHLFHITIALFVALSRIADNHHHWSDVLGGAILGIVVATITTFYHYRSTMLNSSHYEAAATLSCKCRQRIGSSSDEENVCGCRGSENRASLRSSSTMEPILEREERCNCTN